MLKFFRRIRQNLLSEGKSDRPASRTGRYYKYAIGEIVLVVFGILIALSINNWNEGKKDQKKAQAYLSSIRADMLQDLEEIESMVEWKERLICFKEVYPSFEVRDEILNSELTDTTCLIPYRLMFNFQKSFRSNTSTFDAMVADGSANLITNKTLFARIQRLYKFWNPAMLDVYNIHRGESHRLNYKWAQLVTFKPNTNITEVKDSVLIADLNIFFRHKTFYVRNLLRVEKLINELIAEIEEELNE